MGIVNMGLINISLDNNFDEDDLIAIIFVRLLAWHIIIEKRKILKKELKEKLMPLAWHPKRLWDWCVSEDEKKKVNRFLLSNAFNVCNWEYWDIWPLKIVKKSLWIFFVSDFVTNI